MQIFEVTKTQQVDEAIPGLGDLVKAGIGKAIGAAAGAGDPQKIAAAQQAQIDDVSRRALPQWMAKRAQLERTLGTNQVDFNEELEAWLEDNIFRGYLRMPGLDPRYQQAIKRLINVVNNTTDEAVRAAQFKKLISTAMMARSARAQPGQPGQPAAAAQSLQASGVFPTKIDPAGRITIGKYTLDPNEKNDAFMIAMINNLQAQGKL